ncbi:MAG TPA: DUF3710 domain-containing protein [Frankiaceae bacterium]|nr:DUF3710 domain-containing protein [Frankiaceae bacterium]
MAFGRKKRDREDAAPAAAEPVANTLPPEPVMVTTGPYDEADAPDLGDEVPSIDLGGIRVTLVEDVEVRVDVAPEGHVVAAVAVHRGSQMQVNAFAAPRREGIWDDVRTEIAQSLRTEQGGSAEEADGPFGRELRARIPSGQPGQMVPARFIGADGPRWFLRGLITGPAATDPTQAGPLEELFRRVVVVRGNEAMAPRDALPLRLPREAQEAHAAQMAAQAEAAGEDGQGRFAGGDDFNPFERGPEITETR